MRSKREIKNIVVAAPLYPPEIGGPATYVRMLETQLPAHGVSVHVVPFCSVRHLPKVMRHVAYTLKLLRAAKGKQLVYALDPVSVGLPARVVTLVTRKPLWVRLGGDYAWEQGVQRFGVEQTLDEYTAAAHSAPTAVQALAAIQRFVVRAAKKVIVPSTYMKDIVRTWGASEDQLEVIYSALDPLPLLLEKKDYRKKLGMSDVTLFSAGRLVPWKGFMMLIDLIAAMQKEYPKVRLYIAGDGPQKGELHEKIAERGLSESIHLLGKIPKEELGEYIAAADVFVLNTAYEGLSHQLLEVMAIGTPVVTTPVGGNPELIEDGVTGYLCKQDDMDAFRAAITQILSAQSQLAAMTQEAQERTERFSDSEAIRKIVSLLKAE